MTHAHQVSTDTPARLVDVASTLFAASSVEAVSIRSITREANLGPAAVHYHFKTKDALLDAVMRRHGARVLNHVLERGQTLLVMEAPPTPRQVVECVAIPYFDLLAREPKQGAEWLRIVGQLSRAQDDRVIRGAQEATRILYALIERCFPSTPERHRALATAVAVSALVSLVGQVHTFADRASVGVPPHVQRLVVDFVSGGLERAAASDQWSDGD